jgi:alpha-tubulin suppressor-like RCC1 family protein
MVPKHRARGSMRSVFSAVAAFALLATLPLPALAADTTGPTVTTPVLSAATVNQGVTVSVAATATDPAGVISTEVRVDSGAWLSMSPSAGSDVGTPRNGSALINFGVSLVRPGAGFTCALMIGGTVRCWGDNGSGQLGNGTTNPSTYPVAVAGITTATVVSSGGSHACARLSNSTVQCWGGNGHGQLGNGGTSPSPTPLTVPGITTAVGVAAGARHTCAILSDGTARCWGENTFGQVSGSSTADIKTPVAVSGITTANAITAGDAHSCVLLVAGSVRCWGLNAYGQLGNGTTAAAAGSVAVSGITTATLVNAGANHTCVRLSNSSVRCWGRGGSGQLGDGFSLNRSAPVVVSGLTTATTIGIGANHSCARLSNGSITCWGATSGSSSPVTVTGISGASSVGAGADFTCARLSDATVRCWGLNDHGQLGYAIAANLSATPQRVPGISTASAVSAGWYHTCALLGAGAVSCWGNGTPPTTVAGITSASAIGTGYDYQCVLTGGTVQCWGDSDYGLGDGETTSSPSPVTVYGITTATAISVGAHHACARLGDATVKCWGQNDNGQLGDGSTSDRILPVLVNGLANAVTVSAGDDHTCARLGDLTVKCWGSNRYGQLGDQSYDDRFSPVTVTGIGNATEIAAGGTHTCALLVAAVKCWGDNAYDQLGDDTFGGNDSSTPRVVTGITTATMIAGSGQHSCARLGDSTVRCWGRNAHGELGDGTTTRRTSPVTVLGIDTATSVTAGGTEQQVYGHSCARLVDASIRCWGNNSNGELGNIKTVPARPPLDAVIGTLSAGTHQVCVRATDAALNVSAGTACATLTVLDKTAPTATAPKTELRSGVALSATQLRVRYSWTAADNAGGSGVDHYELAKSTDGGTTWVSYASVITSTAATASVASTGTLRVRVRAIDVAGNVGAWATGPLLTPRLTDETSAGITYTGTWSTSTSTGYSGGTARAASAAGASATYTFTGSSIALVTTTGPTRGAAKIYVDGTLITTLDTYSATAAAQVQTWARSWTTAGTHTLKVVIVGTVGRPRFDLDALAVLEGVAPPAPPPVTGGPGPTQPATAADLAAPAGDDGGAAPLAFGLILVLGLVVLCLILPRRRPVRRGHR